MEPAAFISRYFGMPKRLAEHAPFLLSDLKALGSEPKLVVTWLADANLGHASRVLDLGCGKGAVAIALAKTTGCRVEGIDVYPPFIEAAAVAAGEEGVGDRCAFQAADIEQVAAEAQGYDALLYLAVGDVLGMPAETIAILRKCLKPGGLLVIEDAYRAGNTSQVSPEREAMLAGFTSHGDQILRETLFSRAAVGKQMEQYRLWMEARGRELVSRHPDLAQDLDEFLQTWQARDSVRAQEFETGMWMLAKSGFHGRIPLRP